MKQENIKNNLLIVSLKIAREHFTRYYIQARRVGGGGGGGGVRGVRTNPLKYLKSVFLGD